MVTRKLLYHIHKRLNEISSPVQNVPFGGKSVCMFKKTNTSEKCKFKPAELTEMRQKDDLVFKERIGTIDDSIDDT